MPFDPCDLFSDTYAEAVTKFEIAAAFRGVPIERWRNPHKGPSGEPLETLVCEIGPADAPNVLVLNTGTHGTEALAGSAILTGLLTEANGFLELDSQVRAILIHIINPYGAAWSRYVNEDNVDLMKNLHHSDAATPPDALFMAFDDVIDLAGLSSPGDTASRLAARAAFLEVHGLERLLVSLKKGQSDRPRSICYNGRGATWSRKTLDRIIARKAAGARQVLYLDLHTGVGSYGDAHVIVGGPPASEARVRSLLGPKAHDTDLVTDSPSYSSQAALVPQAQFTAATIEAGTVEFGEAFREAMWLEMHHHMYGDPFSPGALENQRRFRSFYYPLADDWRRLWWTNCRTVLGQFVAGMRTWRSELTTRCPD
ncbi:MAG: DUF2817 domain-containing protein [Caulobacter sp.]|nr:DUF2817 domain-containing protein [Caulobacter sp.]